MIIVGLGAAYRQLEIGIHIKLFITGLHCMLITDYSDLLQVYTSNSELITVLALSKLPFVSVGDITQKVDASSLIVENKVGYLSYLGPASQHRFNILKGSQTLRYKNVTLSSAGCPDCPIFSHVFHNYCIL